MRTILIKSDSSVTKIMSNVRFILMIVGTLLVGLGLIMTMVAAASVISEAQSSSSLSPFDQVDDVSEPDKGFVPMIIPIEPTSTSTPHRVATQSTSEFSDAAPTPVVTQAGPTASPEPRWVPDRIVIPALELDAPVVPAKIRTVLYKENEYPQWVAPNYSAAGWDTKSVPLGLNGNTVLFGHHNVHGEVFRYLPNLEEGDLIVLYSGKRRFTYSIALKMILQERNEPLEVRLKNAEWILPSLDERLTLITCWPYTSNTHRVILVATPIQVDDLMSYPVIIRLP
jgi:LPXTG-site transpeptidase (sortase) family protein